MEIVAPDLGLCGEAAGGAGVLVQPGMAILKIAQIDRVRLQANVGEKDVVSIRVGSTVKVTTAVAGQPPITARVTAVFPFVDQGPRTAVVEALVENSGRRFLPGQYVTMQFVTGERSGGADGSRDAVARMGGKATVWVVKDERAEPQVVTTGLEGPERVEITQGLTGDERVIIRGHEGLYAGARVSDGRPPRQVVRTRRIRRQTPTGMPAIRGGEEPPAKPTGAMRDMQGCQGRRSLRPANQRRGNMPGIRAIET